MGQERLGCVSGIEELNDWVCDDNDGKEATVGKSRQVGKFINTGKGFINGKKGHAISNTLFKSAFLHSGTFLLIVPQIP